MDNNQRGIIAGLIAALVLSILMIVRDMMPDLNLIALLADKLGSGRCLCQTSHRWRVVSHSNKSFQRLRVV